MKEFPVNIKSLFNFDNAEEFVKKVEELKLETWYIYDLPLEERLKRVKDIPYFCELKKQAKKNGIKAKDYEIISWLDTMNYMYCVFKSDVFETFYEDIEIMQELVIPLTNKRADYVMFSHNKILIVEFSFNKWHNDFKYENKLVQVSGYKELFASLLPKHIVIGTYTVLLNAEYDANNYSEIETNSKYTCERILPNEDTQKELAAFICKFFSCDVQRSAIEELGCACGYLSAACEEE